MPVPAQAQALAGFPGPDPVTARAPDQAEPTARRAPVPAPVPAPPAPSAGSLSGILPRQASTVPFFGMSHSPLPRPNPPAAAHPYPQNQSCRSRPHRQRTATGLPPESPGQCVHPHPARRDIPHPRTPAQAPPNLPNFLQNRHRCPPSPGTQSAHRRCTAALLRPRRQPSLPVPEVPRSPYTPDIPPSRRKPPP